VTSKNGVDFRHVGLDDFPPERAEARATARWNKLSSMRP
jgi:hypothetical protein